MMREHVNSQPCLLFIGNGTNYASRRTVEGARAAAMDFGVDLRVETPSADSSADYQVAIVRSANLDDYHGVALFPAEPESQLQFINELAAQTLLITVGPHDVGESNRLSHVGISQISNGRVAGRLARDVLPRGGKVAILMTHSGDAELLKDGRDRLEGFQGWLATEVRERPSEARMTIERIAVSTPNDPRAIQLLRSELANHPDVACIVAMDAVASESAVDALAKRAPLRQIPLIALDPTPFVLDAIDDGRVYACIVDDPYRNGYHAVKRFTLLSRRNPSQLPMPGRGQDPLVGEVVNKGNVSSYWRLARPRRELKD